MFLTTVMMDVQQIDDFITAPEEVDYALLESCKGPSSLCEYGGKVQPVGKYEIQDFQSSPPQDPFELTSSSPNSRASDGSLPVEDLEEHAEHQETTNQSEDEMNYFLPPLQQPWTEYLDKVSVLLQEQCTYAHSKVRQCALPIRRIITWQGLPREDSGCVQCLASD